MSYGNKAVKVFLSANVYLLSQYNLKELDKVWNISKANTIPHLKLLSLLWVLSHSGYTSFKTWEYIASGKHMLLLQSDKGWDRLC